METVSKVIKTLMQQNPYYGLFACCLNKEFTDDERMPTACVALDGINYKLIINKDWWYTLSFQEKYNTLLHELLHLCFYHPVDIQMWHALCSDHRMLNIAMDMEVNSYLDWKHLPPDTAAEAIYAEFPNIPRAMGTKFYIEVLKQIDKEQEKGDATQLQGVNGSDSFKKCKQFFNQDDPSHSKWGSGELSDTQREIIKNQLDFNCKEAAQETLKSQGTLPGELKERLQKLLAPVPPVFNWKAYFRRLLGIAFDIYTKPTRRKESERFEGANGLKHKKKHKLLVAIDTSGSVSQSELQEFFNEINHIWKAGALIHVLEIDTQINKEYDYKGKVPEYVSGRGGTVLKPAVDYYNQHYKEYQNMVIFTDGYADQDDCKPLKKMIWIITSEGNQEANYPGIKICIPKK